MRRLLVPLALVFALAAAPAARAADEDSVKKQISDLNSLTSLDAIRDKLPDLLKDKDAAKKLVKAADEMAKLDSKQLKFYGAYALGVTAQELKDYDAAMRFYKLCDKQANSIKSATKIIEAYEGMFGVLIETKKFDDAEDLCKKVMEVEGIEDLDRMKPFVIEKLIQTKTKQGKVDEALKMTDNLIKLDEGGWYFMGLKGWVLHEAGRDEESAKAYLEQIDLLEKNETLKPKDQEQFIDRTRYILSNVYVELNQVDKAAEQLKEILKHKPDNPSYNNDLGYIWADHDMNLDEAEKLVRKAIDLERKKRAELKKTGKLLADDDHDNGAYLDSLGWVLYKKKKFAEAKKELLAAAGTKEGEHIEILDHLADVQLALGEKTEAIATWKKALDMDTSTKRDLKRRGDIVKKLKAAEGKSDKPAEKPAEKK
jgi:tetratricopeptide (TPR) repeat protein